MIEFVLYFTNINSRQVNLKSLRTLRVLRPLRSVNTIPSMRRLVGTLVQSLNELVNVGIFIGFLFVLFGIIGLQLFQGTMYNSCRLTPEPVNDTYWPKADDGRLCSITSSGGRKCPDG